MLPESVSMVKPPWTPWTAARGARIPWRAGGYGQPTVQASGPPTLLRERQGERGPGISRWHHSDRGPGAGAGSRQPGMREDSGNDGRVVRGNSRGSAIDSYPYRLPHHVELAPGERISQFPTATTCNALSMGQRIFQCSPMEKSLAGSPRTVSPDQEYNVSSPTLSISPQS